MGGLQDLDSLLTAHPDGLMLSAGDHSVPLTTETVQTLRTAVSIWSEQMGVALSGVTARLTTSEAAVLLGISRPTLVRLLDEGQIAYERPRKHRLVLLEDVMRYQAQMRNAAVVGA
jgi:excisionase family DNA binding protein